jgi:hypothetical protein
MPHNRKLLLVSITAATLLAGPSGAGGATPSLGITATVVVPSQFGTLGVASGDGAVWATDGTAMLTRVDPTTKAVVASIPVRDAALVGVAANAVWVVGSNSRAYRIDPQSNKVVATVPVARDPTGIAIGAGSLWVAGRNSYTITRISTSSNKITAKIRTPEPARYVVVGAGAVWAASNETPVIWRIDPAHNKIVATIPISGTPNGVAATRNALWVLDATNNQVVRIDPSKNKVRGVSAIPKRDGFLGRGGAITADANSVWVATLTHLLRLAPGTGAVLAALAIGTHVGQAAGLTAVSSGPAGLWIADADDADIVRVSVP